jgi:hypothetical protein
VIKPHFKIFVTSFLTHPVYCLGAGGLAPAEKWLSLNPWKLFLGKMPIN